MSDTYRYNVVISLGIDQSGFQSGKEQAKTEMRRWEQEVIASQQRISQAAQEGERIRHQESASMSRQRLEQLQAARIKELNYEREVLRQTEILEAENYAKRLALHSSFVNSLNRQQQTAAQNTAARSAGAGQGTVTGAFTPSIISTTPTQVGVINQATNAQATQQALLRQFAGNQLNDAARNIQNITGQNILLNETVRQGATNWGIWGRAFNGAFVGAITGTFFSTVISGITGIIEKGYELVKTSVEMAANLEQTTNALTVFTGSSNVARQELAALDETARTTTGLSLPSARDGYQQLRALNFEADLSRKLIGGLGKERLLSGADEQSVQRVVTNLVQLSAGSSRASQDVKEMVHAIPRLAQEFQQAYGTLDFKEIGNLFKKDPEGALQKLADQMEKTKGASGGFNDALLKMNNEIQRIEEQAGKPLMRTLTSDIILLTNAIHDSTSIFMGWGVEIEHTYTGLKKFIDLYQRYDPSIGATASRNASGSNDSFFTRMLLPAWWNAASLYGQSGRLQTATEIDNGVEQRQAFNANLALKAQMDAERKQQEALDNAKAIYKQRTAQVKDSFRVRQAGVDLMERNTPEQERLYAQVTGQLRVEELNKEFTETQSHYAKMIGLESKHNEKREQLQRELAEATFKHQADVFEAEAKTAKQLIDLDRKVAEERRSNLIESIGLQSQAVRNAYDQRAKEVERLLGKSNDVEVNLLRSLEQETVSTYDRLIEKNRTQLDLQLMDKTLSAEKVRNLQEKSNIEELRLEQEKADKIYDINEKLREREITALQKDLAAKIQASKAIAGELSVAGQLLSQENFSQSTFEMFQGLTFGGKYSDIKQGFANEQNALKQKVSDTSYKRNKMLEDNAQRYNVFSNPNDKGYLNYKATIQELIDEQKKYEQALQDSINREGAWQVTVSGSELEVYKLAESIANGTASLSDFDKMTQKIAEGINFEEIKQLTKQYDELSQEYSKYKTNRDFDKANAVDTQRKEVSNQLNLLKGQRDLEITKAYKASLEGINEEISKLSSGDRLTVFLLTLGIGKGLATQQRDAVQEGVGLELTLRNENLQTTYRQIAAQKVYNEQIQKELDALTSVDKSRILIADQYVYHKNQADAKTLEFFASQKGLTDTISDAKISLMTSAYSQLDSVIQRLTKSFGFASDAVSQFLSSLIKLALNKVFMKLFGLDVSGNPTVSYGGGSGSALPFGILPDGGGFGGGGGANGQGGLGALIQGLSHGSNDSTNLSGLLHGSGQAGYGQDASWQVNAGVDPTALLGAGNNNTGSAIGGATSSLGASGGVLGAIGSMLPFIGGGLGSKLGGSSILGRILGGTGGVLGGLVGAGLLGTGGAIGAIGATLAASVVGLVAIPALLVGAYFLGRNKKRRQEEETRNKAMVDAFAQLDKLISDVQTDKIDGYSALTQADQIRQQYLDQMSKLTDKKTRTIALADVSRLDAKIAILKSAANAQQRREDRLSQLVPTFADGGNVSNFISSNYDNNPLGYQTGRNRIGYFPQANTYAMFNEAGNEYIFDAQTTRNIGVRELDAIRASKGMTYLEMKKRFTPQAMMIGGEVGGVLNVPNPSSLGSNSTEQGSNAKPLQLHVSLQVGLAEETFVNIIDSHLAGEGGEQALEAFADINRNQGSSKFLQSVLEFVKENKK